MLIQFLVFFIAILVFLASVVWALSRSPGPVRRHDSRIFSITQTEVRDIVLKVLSRGGSGYRYGNTVVDEDSSCVETRVIPWMWPLLLSTRLRIELETLGNKDCRLTVSTCSQKFVWGDAFGFYDRYIRDLLVSVSSRIEDSGRINGAEA